MPIQNHFPILQVFHLGQDIPTLEPLKEGTEKFIKINPSVSSRILTRPNYNGLATVQRRFLCTAQAFQVASNQNETLYQDNGVSIFGLKKANQSVSEYCAVGMDFLLSYKGNVTNSEQNWFLNDYPLVGLKSVYLDKGKLLHLILDVSLNPQYPNLKEYVFDGKKIRTQNINFASLIKILNFVIRNAKPKDKERYFTSYLREQMKVKKVKFSKKETYILFYKNQAILKISYANKKYILEKFNAFTLNNEVFNFVLEDGQILQIDSVKNIVKLL